MIIFTIIFFKVISGIGFISAVRGTVKIVPLKYDAVRFSSHTSELLNIACRDLIIKYIKTGWGEQ